VGLLPASKKKYRSPWNNDSASSPSSYLKNLMESDIDGDICTSRGVVGEVIGVIAIQQLLPEL
jgi:hypothetical protein